MNEDKRYLTFIYVKLYTTLNKVNMDLGFCTQKKGQRKKRNRLLGNKSIWFCITSFTNHTFVLKKKKAKKEKK